MDLATIRAQAAVLKANLSCLAESFLLAKRIAPLYGLAKAVAGGERRIKTNKTS